MIDLSNVARDVIEIIEATEQTERKRAADIVLKCIDQPDYSCRLLEDILKDVAKKIMDGE